MDQIPDWADDVGEGWRLILEQLHAEVILIDPNYRAVQIKEKFGGLRAYLEWSTQLSIEDYELLNGYVRDAEDMSYQTCEYCGAPGVLSHDNYWLKTLCTKCNKERNDARSKL